MHQMQRCEQASTSAGAIKTGLGKGMVQMTEQRQEPLTIMVPDQATPAVSANATPLSDITCKPR